MYNITLLYLLFYMLVGSTSNDALISQISTNTTNIMTSGEPTSGISNGIYILNVSFRLFIF